MNRVLYTKEFPSTVHAIGETLVEALDVLLDHGWCTKEQCFGLRLCIEEALVNAVGHGNHHRPDQVVRIEILQEGEYCRIRVKDEGHGFDPDSVTMPDCTELGGRGVCLIKHYMDDVRFNCEDNCLEMVFPRGHVFT